VLWTLQKYQRGRGKREKEFKGGKKEKRKRWGDKLRLRRGRGKEKGGKRRRKIGEREGPR